MSASAAIAFTRAAPTYWCSVYPRVCREVERQRRLAAAIPEPALREVALSALRDKRANIDGAAAFAAFVPRAQRAAVLRAQVAFQSLYDYLDVLTERPNSDPVGNSRQLHGALVAALDPRARGGEHLAHPAASEDGGYLQSRVERCQSALSALPSYAAVQPSAARLGGYIREYQSFNVTDARAPCEALARWSTEHTPAGSGLRWWETAASAGSSLGLFALIAMAGRPGARADDALAVERAYFPWVGALHSLLDSLIDLHDDRASGQPALVEHYGTAEDTARGLTRLAEEARLRVAELPDADSHALVLAAMASVYLAEPQARDPHARAARRGVLRALGALAKPALLVLRLRRRVL